MQSQTKYYIQLLSVSIGALILSYGLSEIDTKYFETNHYWMPTLFFVITTVGSNLLLTAGDKQSKEFVFKTLALSMARLLICMIVVFVYSLINKEQALAFTCHFMVQYVIFTIFEMSFLLKYIKSN
jgi:hypothetical protein